IKCRKAGLTPALTLIVATAQGLKMHGGVALEQLKQENVAGIVQGLANLQKHIDNVKSFGQNIVVAFNRFPTDTEQEIALVQTFCEQQGIGFALNEAFTQGGEGALALAKQVINTIDQHTCQPLQFTYDDADSIELKLT